MTESLSQVPAPPRRPRLNTETQNHFAMSISTGDPAEVPQAANSWTGIVLLVVAFAVIPVLLRRRARAGRSTPDLSRSAWLEIAKHCAMGDEERQEMESLARRAGLDPCVIALCPSQFERAALMSAGQSDLRVLQQAIAKLHPAFEHEIKPDPRRRSPGKLNLTT